jgi:crotonobetainyl-CoA:carnitine CoA-transferase CaiB-like acyl-CoA transferase
MNFSATPVEYKRAAPLLGQHTEEILKELLGKTSNLKHSLKN